MSRALDPSMQAALSSGLISPVFLVALTFKTSVQYVWSGVGSLIYGGQVYKGVGSFGSLGSVNEGVDVQAQGTTVTLSGIDPTLLSDSMNDIQPGAPAQVYFGLMTDGVLIGTAYQLYKGTIDSPTVSTGAKTISISISLENRMLDLSRAGCRRYTSADQRIEFPTDIGFASVEQLSDLALIWGT